MSTHQNYLNLSKDTEGWFGKESSAIWDILLEFQSKNNISGNIGEIGVWHGKSALLGAMHQKADEGLLLIDPRPMVEAKNLLGKAHPNTKCFFFESISSHFRRSELYSKGASSFRWFHIDGEHSSQSVFLDLEIANFLLSEDGIISVDDFFFAAYPQVTEAVFSFLKTNHSRLKLILTGFNKGYLCRPIAARKYLEFIKADFHKEMTSRDCSNITIWKSTSPDDSNSFGITNRYLDFDYRGPDWGDQSLINI